MNCMEKFNISMLRQAGEFSKAGFWDGGSTWALTAVNPLTSERNKGLD